MNKELKKEILDNTLVILGTAIAALAMALFLVPNKIAPGGISGLATIIHYTMGLPVGAVMLFINIALFAVAYRSLGKKFAMKTLYSSVIFSVLLDLVQIEPLGIDLFLSAVYGGVLMGIGIGLVYRGGGSTGGTDLMATLIHKKFRYIATNWLLFILDFMVVILAAIFFDTAMALYALVTVYITSKLIEIISEGFSSTMAFFIITEKPREISDRVIHELARGVTFVSGKGMYSNDEKNILFCVLEGRHQIATLRRIVKEEDKKAFVIMSSVREVMGEGFKELS